MPDKPLKSVGRAIKAETGNPQGWKDGETTCTKRTQGSQASDKGVRDPLKC